MIHGLVGWVEYTQWMPTTQAIVYAHKHTHILHIHKYDPQL